VLVFKVGAVTSSIMYYYTTLAEILALGKLPERIYKNVNAVFVVLICNTEEN